MDTDFFTHNRINLTHALKGGLVVLSAYTRTQRRSDMAASFSQETNFWYLTGIDEPDWHLVIDGSQQKTWLIMPDVDEIHRVFDGSLTAEAASKRSGVANVVAAKDCEELLRQLARHHATVHTLMAPKEAGHYNFELNPAPLRLQRKLERIFRDVIDCRPELNKLRAIKQPEEIKALQRSVKLTMEAFDHVRQRIGSYAAEYEIEADFSHWFRKHGASGHAYDPIVATDKNACTLHYVANTSRLRKNALVLMDVGADFNGYAADISRTYVKGMPTKRQLQVHHAVEAAHHDIIRLLSPGLSVKYYLQQVDERMKDALEQIGLLPDRTDEAMYRKYFPHAISHGLGIDVHDSLGAPERFREGMVLTVEPGIYIPQEGIGVRIEDDILITPGGHKNLSAGLSTAL